MVNITSCENCVNYILELEHEIINKDALIAELQHEVNIQKTIAKGLHLLNMSMGAIC